MTDILTVRGLGIELRGWLEPDEFGYLIKPGGMQGWEGLPAGRREALARPLSHGEHDVPVRLPSRVVTVDGWVIAPTVVDLRKMCQRVRAWGATGDRFSLVVTHLGETLRASVRSVLRDATDLGDRDGDAFYAEFQVQFVAADPRQYGEHRVFPEEGMGTSLDVFHRGTFPAHPVVEIPSAPAEYTITSPAGTFTVTGATAGGMHRVDFRTGRVTRNGVWMQGVGRGPLWAVPEGPGWLHVLSVPGRVLIDDTYV